MHDRIRCDKRRQIPAVSKILDALGHSDLPRPFVVEFVRRKLSQIRASSAVSEFESIVAHVRRSLDEFRASRLQSVINGTGIVIHTNFGRAPLPSEAMHALNEIGPAYSNLEYDLAKGERGGRGVYVESALALLCEAEAATVVNNCAAALLLIVHSFHRKRKSERRSPYGARLRLSFHGANWCKSAADFASAKFSKRAARNCARSARPTRPRSKITRTPLDQRPR